VTPYEQALIDLTLADERVVVMTAENRAAIRSLPDKIGSRFIDVGICEQTLIGVAAGLARRGRRPIVHALAAFLTMRAFEFIRTDVGIGRLPVTLVGAVPGLLSDGNGPTHQAIEDVSLMRGIPGMAVMAPSDSKELAGALSAAASCDGPAYIRYYDGPSAFEHASEYALGHAETHGELDAEVAIVTYGLLVRQAVEAQELLGKHGVHACVVDMRSIAPLDEALVTRLAVTARLIVVLEDHFHVGGLFSALAERWVMMSVSAQILPLNLGNQWFRAGLLGDALKHTGLSAAGIADAVLKHREYGDDRQVNRNARLSLHRRVQLNLG
jgi:transketolase